MIRTILPFALMLLLGAAQPAVGAPAPIFVQREPMESHRISGEVTLYVREQVFEEHIGVEVTVDEEGAVVEARLAPDDDERWGGRGQQWLEPALALARQWRFRPFFRDGRPVAARGWLTVKILQAERLPTRHVPFPEFRREDVRIRLTRSACYGSCPSYSVTIGGDGRVHFVGEGSVNVGGEHRYAIPVERVDALIRQFREGDFWSLDESYETRVTDNPTYTLTFSTGSVTKTVTDYVGNRSGMPRIVTALEDAVDAAADIARWTVGNERTLATLQSENFDFHSPRAAHMFFDVLRNGPEALAIALLDRGAPIDLPARCLGCPDGSTVRAQAVPMAAATGRIAIFDRLASDATLAALPQEERDLLLAGAARARSPQLVERLLARGARATATGEGWGSALIQALSQNYGGVAPDADQATVVRLLLANGAPLEARDSIDWTALQHAYDDNPAMARLLIERGARVDAAADDDQPILYRTDDEEIALLALAAGANRSLRDREGNTLSQIARRNRWTRVERLVARDSALRENSPPRR